MSEQPPAIPLATIYPVEDFIYAVNKCHLMDEDGYAIREGESGYMEWDERLKPSQINDVNFNNVLNVWWFATQ